MTWNRSTLLIAILAPLLAAPSAAAGDFLTRQRAHSRVDRAWRARAGEVERAFRDAGAAWPPKGLFFRAFKLEGQLEVWAREAKGARRVRVAQIPICAASGVLGPKVQQGDLQVPEGFYRIDRFNPWSSYHLSLGVSYPNAFDKARARPGGASPGGDIFIHGECVTIGCLPLENGPIEWLYVAAVAATDAGQRRIPVHLFPCRFGDERCEAARAERGGDEAIVALWAILERGYRAFEATGQPPRITTRASGYAVTPVGRAR
ncbi:MAG: hypothetical protein CSA66_01880 [Proteobacteria bacterium]|nr:MAG: hypothetical protein CSA66_01880 [Pseudomonadota bacterium]